MGLLDIEADLSEMTIALEILKGFDNLFKRKVTVNHRTDGIGIQRFDHILLLRSAADQNAL